MKMNKELNKCQNPASGARSEHCRDTKEIRTGREDTIERHTDREATYRDPFNHDIKKILGGVGQYKCFNL